MMNYNIPVSFYSADRVGWGSSGDEPEHPRQCECTGFLKRWGWDYELDPPDGVIWYVTCRRCGRLFIHAAAS